MEKHKKIGSGRKEIRRKKESRRNERGNGGKMGEG